MSVKGFKSPIVNDALDEIAEEAERAVLQHGPFSSLHEAYAVLKEEVDELWDEIKKKEAARDPEKIKNEAKQIGAMALRIRLEFGDGR